MSCCPTCGSELPSRGEIGLDSLARTLAFRGQFTAPIQPERFKMLTLLVSRLGRIVSKGALYDFLFDARPDCDQPDFKIIDVQLCRLRQEVAPTGLNIRTIWGAGVRLEKPDEPAVVTGGGIENARPVGVCGTFANGAGDSPRHA